MVDPKIDVLRLESFLQPGEVAAIVAAMCVASGTSGRVSGGAKAVDPYVRHVLSAEVSPELADLVAERLIAITPRLEAHFNVTLSEVEEPQFLRYRPGDFFVAHQDGNTPLVHDDTLARKVSVIVFLNDRGDGYEGGSLLMHGAYPDWELREDGTSAAGTLIAFRSETTHEVLPVTGGERFTIVSWFRE